MRARRPSQRPGLVARTRDRPEGIRAPLRRLPCAERPAAADKLDPDLSGTARRHGPDCLFEYIVDPDAVAGTTIEFQLITK